jgi:nitric oxide reductase NorE protein
MNSGEFSKAAIMNKDAGNSWLETGYIPGEPGVWIFIFGDMMLFFVLFLSYSFDRSQALDAYNLAAGMTHITHGALNTIVLLLSSIFVALGVRALRENIQPKLAPGLFLAAMVCGGVFMLIKFLEYSDLITQGLTPLTETYYTYYFILTGVHLFHLVIGMFVLAYCYRKAKVMITRGDNTMKGIESGASFWHVVDLLWIAIFPLLYLVR